MKVICKNNISSSGRAFVNIQVGGIYEVVNETNSLYGIEIDEKKECLYYSKNYFRIYTPKEEKPTEKIKEVPISFEQFMKTVKISVALEDDEDGLSVNEDRDGFSIDLKYSSNKYNVHLKHSSTFSDQATSEFSCGIGIITGLSPYYYDNCIYIGHLYKKYYKNLTGEDFKFPTSEYESHLPDRLLINMADIFIQYLLRYKEYYNYVMIICSDNLSYGKRKYYDILYERLCEAVKLKEIPSTSDNSSYIDLNREVLITRGYNKNSINNIMTLVINSPV